MHTSEILRAEHFSYVVGGAKPVPTTFDALFPDYHPLDRVAVVSPDIADGISGASLAVLALTTAFYDALRAKGSFFDYPQHFCLYRGDANPPDCDLLEETWGNLDVWPANKWIPTDGTPTRMLRALFDLQINCVFWPEDFATHDTGTPLPDYALRTLNCHLKQVILYRCDCPELRIEGAEPAAGLVRKSLHALSEPPARDAATTQTFRTVPVAEFLAQFEAM